MLKEKDKSLSRTRIRQTIVQKCLHARHMSDTILVTFYTYNLI